MFEVFLSVGNRLMSISTTEDGAIAALVAKAACLNTHEFVAVFEVPDEEPKSEWIDGTVPRTRYSDPGDCVRIQIEQTTPKFGELVLLMSPHTPRSILKKSVCPPVILAGIREKRKSNGYHDDNRQERQVAFADLEQMGVLKYAHH